MINTNQSSRQLELKILFLLGFLSRLHDWISQEDLLKMLGQNFCAEATKLNNTGLILTKSEQVRPVSVDNFFKLTPKGKEVSSRVRLSCSV